MNPLTSTGVNMNGAVVVLACTASYDRTFEVIPDSADLRVTGTVIIEPDRHIMFTFTLIWMNTLPRGSEQTLAHFREKENGALVMTHLVVHGTLTEVKPCD